MATKALTTGTVGFDFFAVFKPVIEVFFVWTQRRQDRARLAEMDVRLLRDIGMDHADAQAEAGKPFWRA